MRTAPKQPLSQIQKEFRPQTVQRQVLYFLTEHGPTAWEPLLASFDDHHPSRIGLVLYELTKYQLIECDSAKAVSITLLGIDYLKHWE